MTLLPELTAEKRTFLQSLLSQKRIENLQRVLNNRLEDIVVVLDNLFDPHNMGAIVRTVEALGIQDIHVIERDTPLDLSYKVTKYSHKWVSIHTYENARSCVDFIKKHGFQIVVAQMTGTAVPIDDFEIYPDSKIAIVMGNEHAGASEEICQLADTHVVVPMYGFTESYNVSVATALVLADFVNKKRSAILPETGTLSENRKIVLYDQWLQKAVKKSELLLKAFESPTE